MLSQVEIMEIVGENFYKYIFSTFTLSYQDTNTNRLYEVGYLLGIIGLPLKKILSLLQRQEQFLSSLELMSSPVC